MADLRQAGVPEEAAVLEAMARLGDVDTIVGAVAAAGPARGPSWPSVTRLATTWVAVAAMSIVTFAAVELPQASGAKATRLQVAPATHVRARPARSCGAGHGPAGRAADRRPPGAHRCA